MPKKRKAAEREGGRELGGILFSETSSNTARPEHSCRAIIDKGRRMTLAAGYLRRRASTRLFVERASLAGPSPAGTHRHWSRGSRKELLYRDYNRSAPIFFLYT